jgi:drug/metabolite transporter (DMT)-like permease
MKIGPGEILLVVAIILVMVALSRAKRTAQDVKKQVQSDTPARRAAAKPAVKYPQLQLLGVLAMLAGGAMAVIGYLMTQGLVDTLSLAGIGVIVLGIAFIILARRR